MTKTTALAFAGLVGVGVVAAGCRDRSSTPSDPPFTRASATASAPPPSASSVAPAIPGACAAFVAAKGDRRYEFWLPGDPSAHRGCTLVTSGDLQCPQDFVNDQARTKVRVPATEAQGVLDLAEREAVSAACAPCERNRNSKAPAGFDPSQYPARICRGAKCVETCGTARARVYELRERFDATKVPYTIPL